MSADTRTPAEATADLPTRTSVLGSAALVVLGVAWFVMSHWLMHTPTGEAIGEAFGVVFAVLVVVSIIGAVWNSRRGTPR